MSEASSAIHWNSEDQTLSGSVIVDGLPMQICIPRALIHSIPIYSDAVEWEIELFKGDIVERLKYKFLAQTAE
jgi:hypothetical protein